jgi:hypothetical protein
MDYNARMNYGELAGKSVLLLGKTRSLREAEFEKLLKLHGIGLAKTFTDGMALVVEGRMMNPIEQNESERLYEEKAAPIVAVEGLEEWLCRSIEPNRLMMSLKLSRDQERLVDFLKNPYITDELFYKLLKLYDWQNEGLFDNDRNRDVTASVIGRFYVDLDRNHNVQYAMSGLAHLIEQYGTGELIEAIAELSPIARELKTPYDASLRGVLDAMALHPETPEKIVRALMNERAELLACREPLALETELLELDNERVNALLAQNPSLSSQSADRLEAEYPVLIAAHTPLSPERFARLMSEYSAALGANRSLTLPMQERLLTLANAEVFESLASNPATTAVILDKLYADARYHPYLAANPSMDKKRLEELSLSSNAEVLLALAVNPSTPIEVLYQLSLDRRFERSVKTNSAFGKHIQTHNIGWH